MPLECTKSSSNDAQNYIKHNIGKLLINSVLFVCSISIGYIILFLTTNSLDPIADRLKLPTISGWLFSLLVSFILAFANHYAWVYRAWKGWKFRKRFLIGIISYVIIISIAGILIYSGTTIWLRVTYIAEFSPAMKARLLASGIHLAGLLVWLPIHMIAWSIPWMSGSGSRVQK